MTSCPLRVSFTGGGTDYEGYFSKFGGAVIGSAINQRVYVVINPLSKFAPENIRFNYRETESVMSVTQVKHPVMREVLKHFGIQERINIATLADLPGNTGLGSSSAFTVAAIAGCAKFVDRKIEKHEIPTLAYNIERNILGESGGIQDYLHAIYGSFRVYKINKLGKVARKDLWDDSLINLIESRSILVRFGDFRTSSVGATETERAISNSEKLSFLHASGVAAKETANAIKVNNSAEEKYKLLTEAVRINWNAKKIFQSIVDDHLIQMEKTLTEMGAIALKVCGAGESGFILAMFPNDLSLYPAIGNSVHLKFDRNGLIVRTF
jgi:D-glycero-alpha-D-manno-heptose-7-phosphate kinase